MKTHELAEALRTLAAALKAGPNVPVDDLADGVMPSLAPRKPTNPEDIPWALNALLSLSRVDRGEWIQLASDLGLDLEIRPRDASRDILGKVLRVLERQPEARARLEHRARSKPAVGASAELTKALSSLLNR